MFDTDSPVGIIGKTLSSFSTLTSRKYGFLMKLTVKQALEDAISAQKAGNIKGL